MDVFYLHKYMRIFIDTLIFLHDIIVVQTYWFFEWHICLEFCDTCPLFRGMWSLMSVYIFPSGSFNSVIS